jgi:hypothetical protein
MRHSGQQDAKYGSDYSRRMAAWSESQTSDQTSGRRTSAERTSASRTLAGLRGSQLRDGSDGADLRVSAASPNGSGLRVRRRTSTGRTSEGRILDTIDTHYSKAVLIIGRFTDEHKNPQRDTRGPLLSSSSGGADRICRANAPSTTSHR